MKKNNSSNKNQTPLTELRAKIEYNMIARVSTEYQRSSLPSPRDANREQTNWVSRGTW